MSRKSRERRKARVEGKEPDKAQPSTTAEILRKRRNRRLIFVAVIGISFPIFELVAYQFRVITITVVNRSDLIVKKVKVAYDGGEFEAGELKPGGSLSRRIRPDYTFGREQFSTYKFTLRVSTEDGGFYSHIARAGGLDYSAEENYTIMRIPSEKGVQIEHRTRPGFPLSLVRDLMERLGFG